MTADVTAFENHWTLLRFLESFIWDSVPNFSKQFDHAEIIYCLKDTTIKIIKIEKIDEHKLYDPLTASALGGRWVVVVVVVVVVGGGGLGSSLQQTLGRVEFPPLLSGQQKLPYPMSLQPWSLTQGRFFSWLKYSSPQQYWPLQQARLGPFLQSESPFSEQSTIGSMHSPLWMFLLSWWRKQTRSEPHCSLDLHVAFLSSLETAESSSQG